MGKFREITGSFYQNMIEEAQRTGDSSKLDKIFTQGESLQVKGSRFVVLNIDHFSGTITLKLLPKKKGED